MYTPAGGRASLTERTILAGREVSLGRRRGPLAILPFTGPAVIASIAYWLVGIDWAPSSRMTSSAIYR